MAIVDVHAGDAPRYRTGRWRSAFAGSGFAPLTRAQFPHVQSGSPEAVIARVTSISYIAALAPDERRQVVRQVEELLASHPETRGRARVAMPYMTEVFTTLPTAR
jgi:hypothetical protein